MIKPCWLSLTPCLQFILIHFWQKSVPFFSNDLGMGENVLVQLTGNARLGDVMNKEKNWLCANNKTFS